MISSRIASLNGRLSVLGDPLVLASDLEQMELGYADMQTEYEALTLAIETLKEADTELQSRFSPELGRVASEYMAKVTGGRYADVLIDRDFSARARTQGDSVPERRHPGSDVSGGAAGRMRAGDARRRALPADHRRRAGQPG